MIGLPSFNKHMKLMRLLMICAFAVLSVNADEAGFDSVDGPNVRVLRHNDGSRAIFIRSEDNRTLTKRTFSANGTCIMVTIYRMDKNGNPTGCIISDGDGNKLYKFGYGYNKNDGRLVEERMFDLGAKRIDPKTGNEMPVRRFIYSYDALGNRSAPIVITLIPGKDAEDVFGTPSALDSDPFRAPHGR